MANLTIVAYMTVSARSMIRFAVPCALIVAAALLLLFQREPQVGYQLPELDEVLTTDVQRVVMERGEERVELVRTGDEWRLQPQGHRADRAQVDRIVREAAGLELTDLLSADPTAQTHQRYELDDSRALVVSLFGGGQVMRQFQVGKRAPTYGHTYVLLADDRRVFQAAGDLTSVFQTSADALRDLSALSFQADAITAVEAVTAARVTRLTRTAGEDQTTTWVDQSGAVADGEAMEEALRVLSSLRATRFLEADPVGTPLLELSLQDPAGVHLLTLYPEQEDAHSATSSGAEDPFVLLPFSLANVLAAFGLDPAIE